MAIRIREVREQKNMTQRELSNLTGISVQCISRYECEQRNIDLKTAAMLAEALGCTVDDLIDKEAAS